MKTIETVSTVGLPRYFIDGRLSYPKRHFTVLRTEIGFRRTFSSQIDPSIAGVGDLALRSFGFFPSRESGQTSEMPVFSPTVTEEKSCVPKKSPFWPLPKRSTAIVMNDYSAVFKKEQVSPPVLWGTVMLTEDTRHRIIGEHIIRTVYESWAGSSHIVVHYDEVTPIGGYLTISKNDGQLVTVLNASYPAVEIAAEQVNDKLESLKGLCSTSVLADSRESALDLATSLAEGRETVGYLSDKVKTASDRLEKSWAKYGPASQPPAKIKRKLDKFSKKNRWVKRGRAISKLPDKVGGWWMEYRYAITPLMGEVQDAYKAITGNFPEFVTTRGGESDNITVTAEGSATVKVFGRQLVLVTTSSAVADIKVNAVVKQRFNVNTASDLSRRASLYVPNAMWEVVPFSFVADWFLNVGDLLKSTRPTLSVAESSCLTSKVKLESNVGIDQHLERNTASVPVTVSYVTWDIRGNTQIIAKWDSDARRNNSLSIKQHGTKWNSSTILDRKAGSLDRSLSVEVNPMNWKRSIDAVVLAMPAFKKMARRARWKSSDWWNRFDAWTRDPATYPGHPGYKDY